MKNKWRAVGLMSAAVCAGAVSAAHAQTNTFTINEQSVPGTSSFNFNAVRITRNYTEVYTFNTDGTFNASMLWTAGQ